uniref:C-type lectin domain-containing protein n=1 Tax=Clastoptera arizonana TaxID=38151 RepID=A0A1B6CVK9_9HEMI
MMLFITKLFFLSTLTSHYVVLSTLTYKDQAISKNKGNRKELSFYTKNTKQCWNLCKTYSTCDSIVFSSKGNKCRLLPRCAPLTNFLNNNTKYKIFSKRPQVINKNYIYNKESDSCLKMVKERMNYSNANKYCIQQNAKLVSLKNKDINSHATSLLLKSGEKYAWFGLKDLKIEGNPMHSDGSYVRDIGFFPMDTLCYRPDPTSNCWALSNTGLWVQFSCNSHQFFSICQISSNETKINLLIK